jgi:hypothetical protein
VALAFCGKNVAILCFSCSQKILNYLEFSSNDRGLIVLLIDIGGTDDHHCLNFLFKNEIKSTNLMQIQLKEQLIPYHLN